MRDGWRLYALLFRRSIVAAALVYALVALVGLLLLVLPGLYVLARWSLIVPVIVLERMGVGDAIDRSSQLVGGRTGRVLAVVLIGTALDVGAPELLDFLFPHVAWPVGWGASFVAAVLAAPYVAHLLSLLHYRLADPDRPLVHESLERAPSIWAV